MDGLTPVMSEGSAAPGAAIPLDLASPLMQYRETSGLSIRVERLPFKARLSQGRNNGDNSWSLTIDELDGLRYLPPEGLTAAHTLTVRVIRIADDSASTLMRFDVPVSPGGARAAPAPAATETPARAPDRVPAAAPPPPAAEPPPAAAVSAAGPAPAAQRQSVDERANWESEQQDRVAAAVQDAVQRVEAGARVQIEQTNEARLTWEVERRVSEARASWEAEQEGRVEAAVRDAVRKAETDARVQLDQSTEVRLSMELDKRLGEERAAWEDEQKSRVAAAAHEAAQRAEADAIAQMEHANEARIAEVVERRLYEARASWEDEHQEQLAMAVRDAVHKAEADIRGQLDRAGEAQLEQRLGEARASWEAELHGRVASAVRDALEKSEMDARLRFERAQQDWRDASARELAEISARCAQAEAALADALNRPPPGPDNEVEVRALHAELATVQAVVRAREAEIADLRQTLDRAMAEMPGRAIEAEANIERGRAAWHAEREDLLARSEENAQLRVKQALERWQQETKELLNKAKQEWADGEATRLVLAEAKWRENLGIAKSRAPIAQLTKKRSRTRLVGRFKQFLVVGAILTGAYVLYPRVEPMLADSVWPTIVSYKNKIKPTYNKITKDIKAWLVKMEKRGETIRKGKKEPRR